MDSEAQRIRELVIEAGVFVYWVETGPGDMEIVGAALLYLRDELCALSTLTAEDEAAGAACEMVATVDALLAQPPVRRRGGRAA